MGDRPDPSDGETPELRLGVALRRAWVGYQIRLDAAMAEAGFADRRFPDTRALRICARTGEATVSAIGRELGISRQGASKLVAGLRDRGYVTVQPSPSDRREKVVTPTARAIERLTTQRRAARAIERSLHDELGPEALAGLARLLEALGSAEQPRMRDYLRTALGRGGGLE